MSTNDTHRPAASGRPSDDEATLQELDTTVITNPLRQHMNADKDGAKVHSVVIEVNLRHPAGQRETKQCVMNRLRAMLGENADYESGRPYLFRGKSELSGHYVFAALTTRQIRDLASWNREVGEPAPGEPGQDDAWRRQPIYKIWEDFALELYLDRSVSTVKADAARVAFGATGEGVVWAVLDTGVARHRHFEKYQNLDVDALGLKHMDFTLPEPGAVALQDLVDEVGHGTHVAGIIAGETPPAPGDDRVRGVAFVTDEGGSRSMEERAAREIRGVAPQCKIVSLRVYSGIKAEASSTRDLIAALAHVRDVNGDGLVPRIHGVNISLGYGFDPMWFACGSSPLCRAVDALVKSGVVVVVAAGNGGFGEKRTEEHGSMKGGLQLTIRDPGNAALALTVGATHGYMPHQYGVSYFSAKGPTTDGRLKPDLVAPGEKIMSCAAGGYARQCEQLRRRTGRTYEFIEQSGTSMAAPHVSGCIAAFLSLRGEFQTRPEQVKDIFLANATDLGRERYFQGHGLVDLMRTIQAV